MWPAWHSSEAHTGHLGPQWERQPAEPCSSGSYCCVVLTFCNICALVCVSRWKEMKSDRGDVRLVKSVGCTNKLRLHSGHDTANTITWLSSGVSRSQLAALLSIISVNKKDPWLWQLVAFYLILKLLLVVVLFQNEDHILHNPLPNVLLLQRGCY